MSHTPGEFIVSDLREVGKELIEICALRNDKPVCVARIDHRVNKDALDAEDEANAHLIAAAPEMLGKIKRLEAEKAVMLEALETAKQFISNGIELGYIHLPEEGDAALETPAIIEATIRKARGEE